MKQKVVTIFSCEPETEPPLELSEEWQQYESQFVLTACEQAN